MTRWEWERRNNDTRQFHDEFIAKYSRLRLGYFEIMGKLPVSPVL